jgi:hypothetical protein
MAPVDRTEGEALLLHGIRYIVVWNNPFFDAQESLDPPLLHIGILLLELV